MIQATKITIERAEGPCELCKSATFNGPDCWLNARSWLLSQAHTYPKTGGYDKHDFWIEWTDGEKYDGRLDCKHPSKDDNDLDVSKHVRDFIEYLTGEHRPDHMDLESYEKRTKDTREEAKKFLATYQIG